VCSLTLSTERRLRHSTPRYICIYRYSIGHMMLCVFSGQVECTDRANGVVSKKILVDDELSAECNSSSLERFKISRNDAVKVTMCCRVHPMPDFQSIVLCRLVTTRRPRASTTRKPRTLTTRPTTGLRTTTGAVPATSGTTSTPATGKRSNRSFSVARVRKRVGSGICKQKLGAGLILV